MAIDSSTEYTGIEEHKQWRQEPSSWCPFSPARFGYWYPSTKVPETRVAFHSWQVFCLQEEIATEQGLVRGRPLKTQSGQDFLSVEGIPYAEPPVGALRWMPPIPAKSWQGVRDCTEPGHVCPQVGIFSLFLDLLPDVYLQVEQEDHFGNYTGNMIGSEDCLHLNVYSTQSEEALLPVLVWIHGGGFTAGAGAWYRPEYLLDYNLVVVSTNYE